MRKYSYQDVNYEKIISPYDEYIEPIDLTDKTVQERKEKIVRLMKEKKIDCLVIYADLEHGSNFEYLTGFVPRFEESVLVLYSNGTASMLLGNEMLRMADYSRIECRPVYVPYFSLPNQPMHSYKSMKAIFLEAGINKDMQVGIVGWKGFSEEVKNSNSMFDIPYYIVTALQEIAQNKLINCTHLFIDPSIGARAVNNANEIAHYEYGQVLSSNGILRAMNAVEVGKKEIEIAPLLESQGQRNNVVTIFSTGKRFVNANLYPGKQKIVLGDRISLTVGYKGGLASRAAYAAKNKYDLPKDQQDYLERLVKPYFTAIVAWLENICVGLTGKEIYELIETVLPSGQFGWKLNPGHLASDEEWLSSPIYSKSNEILRSGMILQTDIIPSIQGYPGCCAENGVALADEKLKNQIKNEYPDMWKRIEKRRAFLEKELHIRVNDDVLPLSNTVAYYRPFLLNKEYAISYSK